MPNGVIGAVGSWVSQGSYPGILPLAPTPPTVPSLALPVNAPTLSLGLERVILIISGDVAITSQIPNISIQRR